MPRHIDCGCNLLDEGNSLCNPALKWVPAMGMSQPRIAWSVDDDDDDAAPDEWGGGPGLQRVR